MVGTLVVLAVAALCVRLGFWQLERRAEVAERNAAVQARLEAPAVDLRNGVADTAGILYRAARAAGRFDHDRSIVLPGRLHLGAPGGHVVTPLVLEGARRAVLVQRGWLPAADGARVDLAAVRVAGDTLVEGLLVPFPGASASRVPGAEVSAADSFRVAWYAIDEAALRAQFPYRLEAAMLQLLPGDGQAGFPVRLPPPPLDPGPHLGYAIQWFSFALIAVVGWLALMLRRERGTVGRTSAAGAALLLYTALVPAPAAAQLRPVEPLQWSIFQEGVRLNAQAGAAVLDGQTASLAGTRGRLLELGNVKLGWRSDRVAVEVSGTAVRRYREDQLRQEPSPGVHPADGAWRSDAGAFQVATAVILTGKGRPLKTAVRFGTVLPTASNEPGLDRDRTDFFATVGLRYDHSRFAVFTEQGVGINGTRIPDYEQNDAWMYAGGLEVPLPHDLRADALLVGHTDLHDWSVRGNEPLGELRLGLQLGRERWVRAAWVIGLEEFSPERGLTVGAGLLLHDRR
ncbi:MAG: SURF1 family protein [Gemmatimonadota bacterium]